MAAFLPDPGEARFWLVERLVLRFFAAGFFGAAFFATAFFATAFFATAFFATAFFAAARPRFDFLLVFLAATSVFTHVQSSQGA